MNKQYNSYSSRDKSNMRLGLMLKRASAGILSGIGIILLSVSLLFPPSAYAHNIDLANAREVIRDYARRVRADSQTPGGRNYLHYETSCVNAFPGHNHFVHCLVKFQNAADAAKGKYTCKEIIDINVPPHNIGRESNWLYATHTTATQCGKQRFNVDPIE